MRTITLPQHQSSIHFNVHLYIYRLWREYSQKLLKNDSIYSSALGSLPSLTSSFQGWYKFLFSSSCDAKHMRCHWICRCFDIETFCYAHSTQRTHIQWENQPTYKQSFPATFLSNCSQHNILCSFIVQIFLPSLRSFLRFTPPTLVHIVAFRCRASYIYIFNFVVDPPASACI